MGAVDKKWFQDKIRDAGLTQKALGDKLGKDPSTMSLLFQGKREFNAQLCADIARELRTTLDDVMKHAGLSLSVDPGKRIGICGFINGEAAITLQQGLGTTPAPDLMPSDVAAYILRTTSSPIEMMNGWMLFAAREQDGDANSILDRTAIVTLAGDNRTLLRLVRRGSSSGLYTLTGIGQPPMHDVQLSSFRRVILLRPV